MDGSISGAAVATIWRAHELLDLGCAGDQAGTVRVMGWVLGLQSKPGAFSEGCSPPRHAHRACEHFISGFFSPAPPMQRFAPVMFPNGKVFRAEPAARFAVSCLALRAALRGRMEQRPEVAQHLASLVQLQEQWDDWGGYFAPDTIVAGIHALAFAADMHREVLPRLARSVAANQAEDGTWTHADSVPHHRGLAGGGHEGSTRSGAPGGSGPAGSPANRRQLRLNRSAGTSPHRVACIDLGREGDVG